MAKIANQGDISYLMPQLKQVMTFLYDTMVYQIEKDKKRNSFTFKLKLDDTGVGQRIALGTAAIIDWIENQERMIAQAKMVEELGDYGDNVTFLDKGNPKSMGTIMNGIKEIVDKKEAANDA